MQLKELLIQYEIQNDLSHLDVANKVRVLKMATDLTLPPDEQIVKNVVKACSLYEALDLACAWLKVS